MVLERLKTLHHREGMRVLLPPQSVRQTTSTPTRRPPHALSRFHVARTGRATYPAENTIGLLDRASAVQQRKPLGPGKVLHSPLGPMVGGVSWPSASLP